MASHNSEHVSRLAEIAGRLEASYPYSIGDWESSPFRWISPHPPRTKGAIFEVLVEEWFQECGFDVQRPNDSEADRVIEGIRVEIKGSMLWKSGIYKFQQIRNQNYRFIVCLGISPNDAHCWIIPKSVVMELWKEGIVKTQHGGQGGSDTAWFTVKPQNTPDWLSSCGGTLLNALTVFESLLASDTDL